MLQALLFNHIWRNNKNTEKKSEVQSEQQITTQHNTTVGANSTHTFAVRFELILPATLNQLRSEQLF